MNYELDITSKPVQEYFLTIKNYKPLKREEERKLIEDYRFNNNILSRDKLLNANLKYACKLALSYRNKGLNCMELISEANDGLLEAIDKYDLTKDVKLISYSKWWILQRIKLALSEKYKMQTSDLPSIGKDTEQIADDDFIEKQENEKFLYEENKETETTNKDLKIYINMLYNELSERDIDIINMYFGREGYKPSKLDIIGKKYHISQERVRQILNNSYKKMRTKALLSENFYC